MKIILNYFGYYDLTNINHYYELFYDLFGVKV